MNHFTGTNTRVYFVMARFCQDSERLVTAVYRWNVPLSAIDSMCLDTSTGCTPKKVKFKLK